MSDKCSIASCTRPPHALCHGCKKNFCREHMFEHSLSIHLQLNPLVDGTNQINKQLRSIDPVNLLAKCNEQLENWREKSHELVEAYFIKKTQDLEAYFDRKMEQCQGQLEEVQTELIACMREQETSHEQINFLTFQVQALQRDVEDILANDFPLHISPLPIEKHLINLDRQLTIANLPPVYRVIDRSEQSFTALASDNHFLLLHSENALLLVDGELKTYKRTPWTYGPIYDMCYSSTMKRFFVITENEVFLVNAADMSINKIRAIPWQQWFTCTCSDTYLYISTKVYNSSLVLFKLLPSITFFKRWESPDLCSDDEAIDALAFNDNKLALMISNDAERVLRLELRSAATLGKIWSLQLGVVYDAKQAFRFSSINHNEWLVVDHSGSRLIHISRDGQMKSTQPYEPTPCCAVTLGDQMLAVSTKSVVHLHKI